MLLPPLANVFWAGRGRRRKKMRGRRRDTKYMLHTRHILTISWYNCTFCTLDIALVITSRQGEKHKKTREKKKWEEKNVSDIFILHIFFTRHSRFYFSEFLCYLCNFTKEAAVKCKDIFSGDMIIIITITTLVLRRDETRRVFLFVATHRSQRKRKKEKNCTKKMGEGKVKVTLCHTCVSVEERKKERKVC